MDYVAQFEPFVHQFLEWIGFGTIVGLMAKAVMPGQSQPWRWEFLARSWVAGSSPISSTERS